MIVLLIGGTRHLGPAIAHELMAAGHEVTIFHRGTTARRQSMDVEEIVGDARDAGHIKPLLETGRFDSVVDTILQAADLQWYLPLLARHTQQLIHCGSTGVYAPATNIPTRETDATPCPPEFGGFSEKLAQDKAIVEFHRETGFKTCSLRISNVFGAGDVPIDVWGARNPKYYQRIADGAEIWIPNDGRALLQPVHVGDLAHGFRAALESDCAAGQIYNLSSPHAITLTGWVECAKEILGSQSPVKYVPMEDIIATGKANEGGIRFLCEHMCIDSGKAHRELGYEPRIAVREGLEDSLRWMTEREELRIENWREE